MSDNEDFEEIGSPPNTPPINIALHAPPPTQDTEIGLKDYMEKSIEASEARTNERIADFENKLNNLPSMLNWRFLVATIGTVIGIFGLGMLVFDRIDNASGIGASLGRSIESNAQSARDNAEALKAITEDREGIAENQNRILKILETDAAKK